MIKKTKLLIIVFMIIIFSSLVSGVLNDGNAYYSLDNTNISGTNVFDLSTNEHNGTNNGATTGVTGIINEGFYFDGSNDDVSVLASSDFDFSSSDFTLNLWVNTTTTAVDSLWSCFNPNSPYHGWDIRLNTGASGNIHFWDGTSTIAFTGVGINDGSWHMITFISDGATSLKLYIDGNSFINSTSLTRATMDNTAYPMKIGEDTNSAPSRSYAGSLDELGLWKRAITEDEIQDLYNSGSGYNPISGTPIGAGNNITITRNSYYALNSSDDVINDFVTNKLEAIENVVLNFTITTNSSETNITTYYLNFTAGGFSSCSLGNLQGTTCYNYTNPSSSKWIKFVNGSTTSTYDGSSGNQGDRIILTQTGTNNNMNLIYDIDEHYNPNVFKHYEAIYNFSDVKWENGVNQRITGNNYLKIELNDDIIPLDADQYKLDFRVNHSVIEPTQPLQAYICNSSYTNGNPSLLSSCSLVTSKLPSELQDDGTKFRGIFTKNLVDSLGNIKYVVLKTNEVATSKYYFIKTYKATAPAYTTSWNYSTNSGTNWSNLADGYETELNINWFSNGASPTVFHYVLAVNTTNGETKNFESEINWTINATKNYPPIITIINPIIEEDVSLPYNISWLFSEPNDDTLNISLYLINSTGNHNLIVKNLTNNNFDYYWNNTQIIGEFTLLIIACENNTDELYCVNDTHRFNVTDTPPTTPIFITTPSAFYYNSLASFEVNGSTDINNDTITYLYQIENVDKGIIRQSYSTTNTYTPLLGDVGDTLLIRAIASTPLANSSSVNYSTITYLTLANFIVIREKTNTPLNMLNVDELSVSIICSDDVDTTIMTSNNVTLNITCPYEFIKIDANYNNVTYFRIITPTFTPSANITVYMLDLTLDTGVEIILNINDLTGDYSSGSVSIDRFINNTEVNIISQPFDIENSATLFLLKDALYTVSVTNNDDDVRVIGNLIPSSAGEKTLSLPEITFYPTKATLGDDVFWNYTYDNSGVGFIRFDYVDSSNNTDNITFIVYNETNDIVFQKFLDTSTNNTASVIISYTPLQNVNTTFTSLLTINHAVMGEITDSKIFNPDIGIISEDSNVLPGIADAIFWLSLLILLVIGLTFDAQFSHLGMAVLTFFLILFVTFGFISFGAITGVIISIIALLSVLNFITRSRKETGGD